jgi:ABC-type sugar transport system ATPase subunit
LACLTPTKGAFYVAKRRDLVCFCLNESLGNFIAKVRGLEGLGVSSLGGRELIGEIKDPFEAVNTSAIFMDEPTANLGVMQTKGVLDLIRRVRDAGTAVVVISHNLPQILEIADQIVILRLGRTVGQVAASAASVDDLVRAMMSGTVRSQAA